VSPTVPDSPLYLGLASFLHYTKQFGYGFELNGNDRLLYKKRYVLFKIYEYPRENREACGCVLTSVNDLYTVFSEKPDLIKILENECQRMPWGTLTHNPHCKLNKSLWSSIMPIDIGNGRMIRCYRIPAKK
jgi:hypothetical protein